ncbi:recombinase family protein [Streptococcus suis]|uniref:recombinase family protein n=1 Tax=Streptococcus suis TaxID=1307 RepID=UPI0003FCF07D|nr:recombinase family protein [Streptococcus suis]HEM3529007.1 recombinase family protein [Streptococcus suis]
MKAAIYTRVSTFEQTEGYSLDMQFRTSENYCKANDLEIFGTYTDEMTGAKMDRPELTKLLADAKKGLFDCVIVHKLDRLGRSQKDILYIIEDVFLKNQIEFISLTESFDTRTPLGKAMIGFLAVFAQFERDQIRERMQLGKIGRAMEGKPMTWSKSFCPFGYDYFDESYHQNEYSRWVKYIFSRFLAGDTINTIAADLTDRKILNKKWHYSSIKWILENPVYIGKIRWRGKLYDGFHEPIITEEMYNLAQPMIPITKNTPNIFRTKK